MKYLLSDDGMHVELTLEDLADIIINERTIKKDSISIGIDKVQFHLSVKNENTFLTKRDYKANILKELLSRA
jgi:hypothetical protein